jgi:rhodanese-related sulfurtransferase
MSIKFKIWTALLAAILIVGATLQVRAENRIPATVDVRALQEMTAKGKVLLIDVTGLLACLDSRIPGSLCLSCASGTDRMDISGLAKDNKIVFYNGSLVVDPDCPLIAAAREKGFADVFILKGGLPAWRLAGNKIEAPGRIPRIFSQAVSVKNLGDWRNKTKDTLVIDIRSAKDYAAGHLEGSLNFPLTRLHIQYSDIPLDRTLLIVDENDSQSLLAASFLARKGFSNIQRLKGGMISYRRGAP